LNELIEHGHRDPRRYTPGQITVFLDAIARRDKLQRRGRIIEQRIAMADDDSYKKAMRQLSQTDD
jgi:hypothetical protein